MLLLHESCQKKYFHHEVDRLQNDRHGEAQPVALKRESHPLLSIKVAVNSKQATIQTLGDYFTSFVMTHNTHTNLLSL